MKKFIALSSVLALLSVFSLVAFAVDITAPSDVENLAGEAGDSSVMLSWNAATDDIGIKGYILHYGLSPVTGAGQSYDNDVDVGNVIEYKLEGLENGKTYYFSVIAYDEAKNESEAWASELALTPRVEGADLVAPQVVSAEAISKEEVRVVFSKEIVLPVENANIEFSIENRESFEALEVKKAMMDEEDKDKKSVILETLVQSVGVEYQLTVNLGVKDKAGNNIISGTSDTALFTGSDKEKIVKDTSGPKIVKLEVLDMEHIIVQFDKAVVLSLDPSDDFIIVEKNNANNKLGLVSAVIGKSDDGIENASVLIKTDAQKGLEYMLSIVNVTDMAGNSTPITESTRSFMGLGENAGEDVDDPVDPVDPVDPTDPLPEKPAKMLAKLMAKAVFEVDGPVVKLSWDILADAKDFIESQKVYMSRGSDNDFQLKQTLGANVNKYDVLGLEPGDYWFMVSAIDKDGIESEGIRTGKIIIAETGPGVLGLVLVSFGLAGVIRKKRA